MLTTSARRSKADIAAAPGAHAAPGSGKLAGEAATKRQTAGGVQPCIRPPNTHMATEMELLILCVVGLLFYLTPTIIANHRRHPQVGAIAALNILLGWSQLGWVAAFVWALTNTETYGAVRASRATSTSMSTATIPTPAIASGPSVGSRRG